jgi:competence protein ComK
MENNTPYIVNVNTDVFIPYYNEFGELRTIVLEKNACKEEALSPYKLVDYNLRYYGSSMRGARDGTKAIIGNVSLAPVMINEKQGIYMVPSKSPRSDGCIWFNLDAYLRCEPDQMGGTYVILTNGNIIQVDVPRDKMEKLFNTAYILKSKREKRTKQMEQTETISKRFFVKFNPKQLNFELFEEEHE